MHLLFWRKWQEKMARVNGRKLPSGVLVSDINIELDEKLDELEAKKLISPRENDSIGHKYMGSRKSVISLLWLLLSPELVRSTLLLWMVFFGNAFTYYGLVLLITELNSNHDNCTETKLQSNNHQDVSYGDVFFTSFTEFPGLLLSAATVDKLGQLYLTSVQTTGVGVASSVGELVE